MFFVRARTSGPWRTVDQYDFRGEKFGERYLIMAREQCRWSVDNRGVDVQPGVCVSFRDAVDADWFLQQRRAEIVIVQPDAVVCFEGEADAGFFVKSGQAERMSQREVEDFFAALSGAAESVQPEPQPEPEAVADKLVRRGRKPKS